ncbi:Peptidoglycan/LPS O-acetylase OafA/YrhL, contains acyltransferase and SGNH-hydrolase domains [Micromonospora phaseoli]|uniref:Peptidoglycan/LPS O-acetylase OafA/YrhL, contains acyltransferase and SGNH-hydrolase domains n=1 Tax=Micromonospora phaseoli TaxID=1144548 RepID=A0A1H6SJ45_9ACTN|nr:acyltransferase [Micromonospora phaseoli]PZW03871.1 peptidoglycan/LPS O-acetylase OafA/YrhL [Micromonospora phaseoli]GIJ77715.1 acyltransferase [Micromonospora phaseoli]SEI64887.1 Peptidoglycan/LPS O-acetylase OafA/YrhL, contains acyltransferase and SGNH-hydrolase domains [Micromonospora phaseoli]
MTSTSLAAPATTPPGRTDADRLPSLTGLRWVAALLVFGFHAGTMRIIAEPGHQAVVGEIFTLGLSGVQFFFILSGFVLVWSARPGDSRRRFWRRRLAKIYPNHLVLWVLAMLAMLWFADPINPVAALENLFLVQAWDPRPGYFYSVNNVSWSLSCELFFYLCLPLALPAVRRARPWMLWAVVIAVPLLIVALWPGQTLVPEQSRWWFAQVFPLVRSLEFWLGVAAAELMLRGRWRGPRLPLASLIFVATWVAASLWIRAEFWSALLSVAYVLVIAAAADADVHGRRSPLRSRPMVWLGEVSFAFYLVHVFVIMTILRLTGDWGTGLPGWWGPLAVIGFLLLTLALAGLLHRYVEQPMMRRLAPPRAAPGGAPRPLASVGSPAGALPLQRAPQGDADPTTYAEQDRTVHPGR